MSSDLARHWTLDPDVVFLTHGTFGACPRAVLDVQSELRSRLEREPMRFLMRDLEAQLDAVRAVLAPFIGAEPADLVFVPNATTGVNTVLKSIALRTGDEVLVTDHAYAACRNTLDAVARTSGARIVVAAVPFPLAGAGEIVDAVVGAATPRTRLALLDHVTSPTALVFPIAELVAALERRGVDTLVDGAHAPGMVDVDLERLGAAYYTANCHKWSCAPKGAAFLWVRRDRQSDIHPLVTSHGATAALRDRSRFRIEFDWTGTDDPTAILSVPTALRVMSEMVPGGWPEVRRRNHELAVAARRLLCDALAIPLPCPDDLIGSLAAVPLPLGRGEDQPAIGTDALQGVLAERYRIEVPVYGWPSPPRRLLRVSCQLYNSLDDYERLAAALRAEGVAPGVA
jgi:isopenicillin-N epimerase